MPEVVVYTKPFCPYCMRATQLLEDKGVAFTDIEAATAPDRRREMIQRSGRATYPQVFVGERHVGGCDDLLRLDSSGELDRLLAA